MWPLISAFHRPSLHGLEKMNINISRICRNCFSEARRIRPLPKLTTALVSHVEAKERSFIDYREMYGLQKVGQGDNEGESLGDKTESPEEFIHEWKFGQPFYAPKHTNEQIEEALKAIAFKYFDLDAPENAEFASRWQEISLEHEQASVEVRS